MAVISIPRSLAQRIEEEARRLGVTIEEYLIELVTQGLDPEERAREYIEAAKELLEEAREELGKGDIRQAAEKVWGAAALTVKAYAWYKENRRLASHGELWKYSEKVAEELGEWILHAWHSANAMHICFYEAWCTRKHVETALDQVEKLIREVESRLKKS